MTGTINLGNNYTVEEDSNGDLVITDGDGTAVMSHDDSADQWTLEDPTAVNDLVDAVTSNTVYDSSAEQVGDGNQDADLNALLSTLNANSNDITNVAAMDVSSLTATLAAALNANSNDITNVGALDAASATVTASPSAANDVAIKEYVDSVAQGLDWQDSVIDEQNTPPSSPSTGDRYLVDDSPTGDWSGHPNEIAEWDGSAWQFFVPNEGWATYVEDIDLLKVYTADSGNWIQFGSAIDHGALAGLGDDDHTQYLLVDGTRAMSGALDMGTNPIQNVTNADTESVSNQDYNEAVGTQTGTSGTVTVDLSTANMHEIEADGDITIQFSNVTSSPPGNSILLRFSDNDTTGPHTITWPASVEWSQGTVRDTIGQDDDLEVALRTYDGGTTWLASRAGVSFA